MIYRRPLYLLASPLVLLTACTKPQDERLGSRLVQPPTGAPLPPPEDIGDIAVAGSNIAEAIRTLPEIVSAPKPPIIQLQAVTSIVINGPVDTEPYANLLRDRLNAGDDNKVHYMERQLPQLNHVKRERSDDDANMSADYNLFAELQGNARNSYLTIQVQLIDARTSQVVFDKSYHIRQEGPSSDAPGGANVETQIVDPAPTPGTNPYQPVIPSSGGSYSPQPPPGVQ